MALFASKKKNLGYSYFAAGVNLTGRLCFNGIIRLDGRVKGEIVSSGTLVVEETAVITGNIMVENIILSGTVYGNIKAAKQVHLNATAKVFGDMNYGELSIEGAVHEGKSHKLTPDEVEQIQSDCAAALAEDINKSDIEAAEAAAERRPPLLSSSSSKKQQPPVYITATVVEEEANA